MEIISKLLIELATPTPSGFQKLTTCWPNLSFESRLILFDHVKHLTCLNHLRTSFYNFVFKEDETDYLKYLAAKELGNSAVNLIEQSDSPLVKYSIHETDGMFGAKRDLKEKFFSLPHLARLACLRDLVGCGDIFAEIVIELINSEWKEGKLSENQFSEILVEYLDRATFKNSYTQKYDKGIYDGYAEFLDHEALKKIWSLVPLLPINLSQMIILHTPHRCHKYCHLPEIPREILKSLDPVQLSWLLERSDVGLSDFRKEIFFREVSTDSDSFLVNAASLYNFELSHEEFGRIIAFPKKITKKALEILSWSPDNFRLVILFALRDLIKINQSKEDDYVSQSWSIRRVENEIERKIKSITGGNSDSYNYVIMELKIYCLAKELLPWTGNNESDDDRKDRVSEKTWSEFKSWIAAGLKSGQTWNAFLSFRKTLSDRKWRSFAPLFPLIEEYINGEVKTLDRLNTAEEIEEADAEQEARLSRFESKINDLQSSTNRAKAWIIVSALAILLILIFR